MAKEERQQLLVEAIGREGCISPYVVEVVDAAEDGDVAEDGDAVEDAAEVGDEVVGADGDGDVEIFLGKRIGLILSTHMFQQETLIRMMKEMACQTHYQRHRDYIDGLLCYT